VYSHVHFSGPVEQYYRQQLGNQVQSKTNIESLTATYQLTPRFSLLATLPFLNASRRLQTQYATLHTAGFGDLSIGAQGWLRSPKSAKANTNNVQIGLSLLTPTGNDRQVNNLITTYGSTVPTQQAPDYSVQPGGGAWGMIMQAQAFQNLGNETIAYCNVNYVMTQGGYHNFYTSHGGTSAAPPVPTAGLTQFDAIQDQYLVEIGASHPAPKIRGLGLTLSVRDEGVPARNLIGNDLGFRRPGFGISLTPGFIYTRGNHMLQFSVGKALVRDRTRSVPEQINGVHAGDAAFANYVWMAGYTLRLPKKRGGEEAISHTVVPHSSGAPAADNFKPFKLKTLDGTDKTLQDFANKVTLVSFFFPKCPSCNAELPEEQKIYDKYKDKGLSMVWINILPDEEELVAGWEIKRHLNVPVLVGASQDSLEKDYHVTATPTNFLLGEKGEVLLRQNGYKLGDEKTLEARIAQALNIAP
jgi:thiol-disulfide isomerase/thioredoxin